MTLGLLGLVRSRKATMCLIILAVSSVALFLNKLTGIHFAAIVGTIGSMYVSAHAYQQINSGRPPTP